MVGWMGMCDFKNKAFKIIFKLYINAQSDIVYITAKVYHANIYPSIQESYERFWIAPSKQYIQFYVKSCHDAKIALSFVPLDASRVTYEIILGVDDNTHSVINYIDAGGENIETVKVILLLFIFICCLSPSV